MKVLSAMVTHDDLDDPSKFSRICPVGESECRFQVEISATIADICYGTETPFYLKVVKCHFNSSRDFVLPIVVEMG